MPHHASQFIQQEIARPSDAITDKTQSAAIDQIGEQNAVAGCYFGADGIGRMPAVVGHGEGIAGVRRKRHLRLFRPLSIRQGLVKDGADVRDGIIRRQIKLDGDSFPKGVRVGIDTVSRECRASDSAADTSQQNRNLGRNASANWARAGRGKRPLKLARATPGRPFSRCAVFPAANGGGIREKGRSSLRVRFAVRPTTTVFASARHSPIIALVWQGAQHRGIKIIRENPFQPQVVKWRVILSRISHPFHYVIRQV